MKKEKRISSKQQLEDMIDRIDEFVYRNRSSFFTKLNEDLINEEAWYNLIKCDLCRNEISARRFTDLYQRGGLEKRAIITLLLERGWRINKSFKLDGRVSVRVSFSGTQAENAKAIEKLLKRKET